MLVEKLLTSLTGLTAPVFFAVPVDNFSFRDQHLQSLTGKTENTQHILWDFLLHSSDNLKDQLAGLKEEAPEGLFDQPEEVVLHLVNLDSVFFREITENKASFWSTQAESWAEFLADLPCSVCLWANHGSLRTLSPSPEVFSATIKTIEPPRAFSLEENSDYQQLLQIIQSATEDQTEVAIKEHEAGVLCSEAREWLEALTHFSTAVPIWESLSDPQVCRSYNNIASIYHLFGDMEMASVYYGKTLGTELEDINRISHARAEVQSGHILAESDSETAMAHYARALEIFEEEEEESLKAEDYLEMANIQMYISEFDEAIDYLRIATSRFTKEENKQGLISSLRKLASIYEYKGKLGLATKCYKNIATLMEASNEETGTTLYAHEVLANAYQQVASLELKQKNFEEELVALQKALEYARLSESPFLIASMEDSLGSALKKKEKKSSFLGSFFNKKS